MQALIDGGKYKVMEVLYSDDSFDLCICVDVLKNSGESVIVNTLKGRETIRAYLPLFVAMKENGPKDFAGLITADGSISAVFKYHTGSSAEEYFAAKKTCGFSERLDIAENLLLSALELDLADDRIAAGVLCEKNTVIDDKRLWAGFNYKINLHAEIEENYRSVRLGEIMRKIFPPDRYLPDNIERFIGRLQKGEYPSCVAIYSAWKEASSDAERVRDRYLEETYFEYLKRKALNKKNAVLKKGE